MDKIELIVKGMTCSGCQAAVKNALSAVPGVSAAEVDLAAGRASVEFDTGRASRPDLEKAVEEAGFKVGV
ncbi:MAG: heavy-metal-associated domain-containing protein [bacterium]|nr:heavy-metal-associated domain-containing protein [bacterium]